MPIHPGHRGLYPFDWRQLPASIRFRRAGGRCERCGRPHGRDVLPPRRGRAVGVSGRAPLAAVALAMTVVPTSAETHVGPVGAVFCETLPSFRSLIAAMLARDEAAAAHLDDCTFLKSGVRIEVLRDLAVIGSGVRIVAVRVYGNGTSVDGYTLDSNLGDAMPTER